MILDTMTTSTVDYGNIFDIINSEMGKECNLLKPAHTISSRIYSEIKSVNNCKLEIIKLKPPLEGDVGSSSSSRPQSNMSKDNTLEDYISKAKIIIEDDKKLKKLIEDVLEKLKELSNIKSLQKN